MKAKHVELLNTKPKLFSTAVNSAIKAGVKENKLIKVRASYKINKDWVQKEKALYRAKEAKKKAMEKKKKMEVEVEQKKKVVEAKVDKEKKAKLAAVEHEKKLEAALTDDDRAKLEEKVR